MRGREAERARGAVTRVEGGAWMCAAQFSERHSPLGVERDGSKRRGGRTAR